MRLYGGSDRTIMIPTLDNNTPTLDFGLGFYLATTLSKPKPSPRKSLSVVGVSRPLMSMNSSIPD